MATRGVIKELARKVMNDYCFLSDDNAQTENEKIVSKAIKGNDVETLKEILNSPNFDGGRLGSKNSILSAAVLSSSRSAIRFLIDNDCSFSSRDAFDNTVFHLIVWAKLINCPRIDRPCYGCEINWHRFVILEILFSAYVNDPQALLAVIFSNFDKQKMTPFLLACAYGCDALIVRFLSLINKDSTLNSIDNFIGYEGNNVFHYLAHSSNFTLRDNTVNPWFMLSRMNTVRVMFEKVPLSDRLINAKNEIGQTPLCELLRESCNESKVIDLIKIFFQNGACPDTVVSLVPISFAAALRDRFSKTYLDMVIKFGHAAVIEILLRAGCRTDICKCSPLFEILKRARGSSKVESVRIIELFLAYGYDLQKELFLYTIDDSPIKFASSKFKGFSELNVDREILEALRELRRSNKMLSLQRQCRNTIRRYLKGKADEVIANLTCIPVTVKSFLLVENEEPILKIL